MKKIVRLTESDLINLVREVIKEQQQEQELQTFGNNKCIVKDGDRWRTKSDSYWGWEESNENGQLVLIDKTSGNLTKIFYPDGTYKIKEIDLTGKWSCIEDDDTFSFDPHPDLYKVVTRGGNLNVRKSNSTNSPVVTTLKNGATFYGMYHNSDWVKYLDNNLRLIGYVHSKYLNMA